MCTIVNSHDCWHKKLSVSRSTRYCHGIYSSSVPVLQLSMENHPLNEMFKSSQFEVQTLLLVHTTKQKHVITIAPPFEKWPWPVWSPLWRHINTHYFLVRNPAWHRHGCLLSCCSGHTCELPLYFLNMSIFSLSTQTYLLWLRVCVNTLHVSGYCSTIAASSQKTLHTLYFVVYLKACPDIDSKMTKWFSKYILLGNFKLDNFMTWNSRWIMIRQ